MSNCSTLLTLRTCLLSLLLLLLLRWPDLHRIKHQA
jgi:hypothetical protein